MITVQNSLDLSLFPNQYFGLVKDSQNKAFFSCLFIFAAFLRLALGNVINYGISNATEKSCPLFHYIRQPAKKRDIIKAGKCRFKRGQLAGKGKSDEVIGENGKLQDEWGQFPLPFFAASVIQLSPERPCRRLPFLSLFCSACENNER